MQHVAQTCRSFGVCLSLVGVFVFNIMWTLLFTHFWNIFSLFESLKSDVAVYWSFLLLPLEQSFFFIMPFLVHFSFIYTEKYVQSYLWCQCHADILFINFFCVLVLNFFSSDKKNQQTSYPPPPTTCFHLYPMHWQLIIMICIFSLLLFWYLFLTHLKQQVSNGECWSGHMARPLLPAKTFNFGFFHFLLQESSWWLEAICLFNCP